MKRANRHEILLMKGISLFLYSLIPFVFCYGFKEPVREDILQETKESIKNECGETEKTRPVISFLDSLSRAKTFSETDFRKAITQASEIFRQQGKLIPVAELYLHTISYYKQIEKPLKEQIKSLVLFYIPLGASYGELGMWNMALNSYFEALNLAEEYGLEEQTAMIYNNMGVICYHRGELKKAEDYYRKAVDINRKFDIKNELFNNYNNLGGIYIQHKDYKRALEFSLLAIRQLDEKKDAYRYYSMQNNIADIYLLENNPTRALTYLIDAMQHQIKEGFTSYLPKTYLSLSRAYEMKGIKDSAQIYIEKSLEQLQIVRNKHIESKIWQETAAYYERNGNRKQAYNALKKMGEINDSISQADNLLVISNIEKMLLSEKMIRENEMQIKNITLQKLASDRLWIISASVALLLVIVVLYLINYSKNKEKERKREELLHQYQMELQKQKELEFNYTIEKKNHELVTYTLSLVKTNEFISGTKEELKQVLHQLNPRDRQKRTYILHLIDKLNQQSLTDRWDEFNFYFEEVHPSFYHNLEKRYPDLTLKEKRLCVFLRLGLSSKEISAITFKEVRSIASARNRLRKKLGLGQDDNITNFLYTITD
jgi:tetratricopeptide (TPR) repeat protein